MRLRKVEKGHRFGKRLSFGLIRILTGKRVPDVLRVLYYRPELFGEHFSDVLQDLLRGDSDWTVGERELFAAYVSKKNQCLF